jgi:hypothetical protein
MILCDANGSCDPVKLSGHYHDNTTGRGRDCIVSCSKVRDASDTNHFRWKNNVASILPSRVSRRFPEDYQWTKRFMVNNPDFYSGDARFRSHKWQWLPWLQYFSVFSVAPGQFWDNSSIWEQLLHSKSFSSFIYHRIQHHHFDTENIVKQTAAEINWIHPLSH